MVHPMEVVSITFSVLVQTFLGSKVFERKMATVSVGSPFQVKSPLLKSTSPNAGNKFQVQSPLLKKSTPASPATTAAPAAADGGCANGN